MNLNQASTFLTNWVTENINADAYPVNRKEARRLAKVCEEAAEEQGITKAQLEEVAGQEIFMVPGKEPFSDIQEIRVFSAAWQPLKTGHRGWRLAYRLRTRFTCSS